jgi:hypothetical protein
VPGVVRDHGDVVIIVSDQSGRVMRAGEGTGDRGRGGRATNDKTGTRGLSRSTDVKRWGHGRDIDRRGRIARVGLGNARWRYWGTSAECGEFVGLRVQQVAQLVVLFLLALSRQFGLFGASIQSLQ